MGTLLVENCSHSASFALTLNVDATKVQHVTIRLRNNTWVAGNGIQLILSGISGAIPESHPADAPLVTMESAQNVFDLRNLFLQVNDSETSAAPPPKETLMDACRRLFTWRDEGSLYPSQVLLGVEATKGNHIVVDGQAAWDRFWNLQPTAARSGTPKFQGGDVCAHLTGAQALGPEAFRLRAGQRRLPRRPRTARTWAPTSTWSAPARPTSAGRKRPTTSSGSRRPDRRSSER